MKGWASDCIVCSWSNTNVKQMSPRVTFETSGTPTRSSPATDTKCCPNSLKTPCEPLVWLLGCRPFSSPHPPSPLSHFQDLRALYLSGCYNAVNSSKYGINSLDHTVPLIVQSKINNSVNTAFESSMTFLAPMRRLLELHLARCPHLDDQCKG